MRQASLVFFLFLCLGCSDASKKITLQVSFDETAAAALANRVGCSAGATSDGPLNDTGLDCDSDGGVVAFQTPTTYKLALKSIYFKDSAGTKYDVFDFGSLDKITSEGVFSFDPSTTSTGVNVPNFATAFTPASLGFELYYFQLTLKIYGEDKEVRIYMSDDDFADQGARGHHQGDVTYTSSDGVELWAGGSSPLWFPGSATRTSAHNGAGGTDAESGHARGWFGDSSLWNEASFQQGATKDIFVVETSLPAANLNNTLTFSIKNTWFYEDFETSMAGSFDPCLNSSHEACDAGAEWAPLFPTVKLSQ